MRKRMLAVLGVVLVGMGGWWWFHRTRQAPPTAAHSETPTTKLPRGPGGQDRGGQGPAAIVDDDAKGTLRLEGQVIDAHDEPVGGAKVILNANPPRTVVTESDGAFAFDELLGRPYSVIARAPGGVAGPVTARVTAHMQPITLRLRAAATVTVKVEDSTAKPIDGATVELHGADQQTGETKAGIAIFTEVVPGPYQVTAQTPNLARAAAFLMVGNGQNTTKLVLLPGAPVSGTVVDDHGAPVAGARVGYESTSDFLRRAFGKTEGVVSGADGAFTLPPLAAGSYRFLASHPSFAPGQSELVTVDGKTAKSGVVIKLLAGATVRGRVVDLAKQPIAGARVHVQRAGRDAIAMFSPPHEAYSGPDGAFELKGLTRGDLSAIAIADAGASSIKAIDTSHGDVSGVELVLDVTGSIAGTVVDSTGQPIEGVQVSAGPNFGFEGGSAGAAPSIEALRMRGPSQELTDADGRFTIVGLAPGSYRITAQRGQRVGRFRRFGEGTVAETGTKDLKIVLQPEGGVKGKVVMQQSGNAPAAFTASIGGVEQSFTGTAAFELDGIDPGHYGLTINGPGFAPGGRDVDVPAGSIADVGTISLKVGRQISGVVSQNGTPVGGATVYAGQTLVGNGATSSMNIGGAGGLAGNTKSDVSAADGTFAISGLDPGDLTVIAEHPTYGRSKPLRIAADSQSTTGLQLALQPPGAIYGVVNAGGKPQEGTLISCQSTTTPGAVSIATTGADGSYRYDQLAADTYKVSAMVGMPFTSMKFYSLQVTLPSGGNVQANISADPGSVQVTVTAQSSNGTLGLAMGWIINTTLTASNASQLQLAMAAAGQGASQMALSRSGAPFVFADVIPGTHTICIVPFPTDIQGAAAMTYAQKNGSVMPTFCQPLVVPPAPPQQAATIQVAVPPDAGSGAGAP